MTIQQSINKNTIIGIIQGLGTPGRRFKSEAQFQFELAWKLKEHLLKSDCENDPKVFLEYYSCYRTDGNRIKRFFTDIMILDNAGNYIPIELKYKTVSINAPNLFDDFGNHGATDLGRFDYLWDVKRIQILKNKNNSFEFDGKLESFCGGYAILLTNDEHYWNVTKSSFAAKTPLYYDFCIGRGDTIIANNDLRWKNDGKNTCVENTWRNDHNYVIPLRFDHDHMCDWYEFCPNDRSFQFLIMNVL